jgi:hypothetical protein
VRQRAQLLHDAPRRLDVAHQRHAGRRQRQHLGIGQLAQTVILERVGGKIRLNSHIGG